METIVLVVAAIAAIAGSLARSHRRTFDLPRAPFQADAPVSHQSVLVNEVNEVTEINQVNKADKDERVLVLQ